MSKGKKIMVMVGKGAVKNICAAMGLSAPTVINALKGRTDNDLARRIRYIAVREFGGIEYIHEPQA